MNLSLSTVLQVLTWLATVIPAFTDIVPEKYKAYLVAGGVVVSATLHQLAGKRNPDGTPACVAYVPKTEQK